MIKKLAGTIISELDNLGLNMIGLKLIKIPKELAEKHYEEHKEKPFYNELIEYITGNFHDKTNVIAMVYSGENAIEKIRELVGKTHPDEAHPTSLRGKYGKINTKTNCNETVIHASDSEQSADREIKLWFSDDELVE